MGMEKNTYNNNNARFVPIQGLAKLSGLPSGALAAVRHLSSPI